MPNLTAHIEFAKEVEKLLPLECRKVIALDRQAYLLGSIGPDYLFALREIGNRNARYANKMQEVKTWECLQKSAEWLHDNDSPSAFSYMLGLNCHYVLDFNVHAYVNFFVEEVLGKPIRAELQSSTHTVLESALDCYFIEERAKLGKASSYNMVPDLTAKKSTLKAIAKIYTDSIDKVFDFPNCTEKEHILAFKMTKLLMKLSIDRTGLKRPLVNWIEDKKGGKKKVSPLLRPAEGYGEVDFFNEARRPFYLVRGEEATSTETLYEVIDKCKRLAVEQYIPAYYDAVTNGKALDKTKYEINYEGLRVKE